MQHESLRPVFALPALIVCTPAVVAAVTAWAYARRPRWSGLPAISPAERVFAKRSLVAPLLVFVVATVVGITLVVPSWRMQTDEERDQIMATLCVRHVGCPVIGNEMNQLRIPLGPLARYCMVACRAVSPDPRFTLGAILALHIVAAVWVARLGDTLAGAPAGAIAGIAFAVDYTLLDAYAQPSNGAWAPVALVATLWAMVRWARGDGGIAFVAMVTGLVCAVQFHGTSLAYVPVIALVAVVYRPRTPRASVAVALVLASFMYAPWIAYQWETDFASLAAVSLGWIRTSPGGVSQPSAGAVQRLVAPLVTLGPVAFVAMAGAFAAVRAARNGTGEIARMRGAAVIAALVPWALLTVGSLVAGSNWADRYDIPLVPGAAVAASMTVLYAGERAAARRGALALAGLVVMVSVGGSMALALKVTSDRGRGMRARGALWLDESERIVRLLGRHGVRVTDFEHRVHGVTWNRWKGAHVYLGEWLLTAPVPAAGDPAVHVEVAECAPVGGARWIEPAGRTAGIERVLVGYVPEIARPVLSASLLDGTRVSEDDGVPFFGGWGHMGDMQLRDALDPGLRPPPGAVAFLFRSDRVGASSWHLATTLARGDTDRVLSLVFPPRAPVTMTIGGEIRTPHVTVETEQATVARYRVTAAERAVHPLAIAADIALESPRNLPFVVDLYDGPPLPCVDGTGAIRAR